MAQRFIGMLFFKLSHNLLHKLGNASCKICFIVPEPGILTNAFL